MSSLLQKRKTPDPKSRPCGSLAASKRVVLDIIKSKKENAIYIKDLKDVAHLPDLIFIKCIKSLLISGLVKEVPHVQFKGRKHYIAAEFDPSEEITGGSWYANGELDTKFINELKDDCIEIIDNLKVATVDGIYDCIKRKGVSRTDCTREKISEMLRCMVLDDMIVDVTSTGFGELCYKSV